MGLLKVKSRKKDDFFLQKTGAILAREEIRSVLVFSSGEVGAGTYNLYTVPASKKAKLIFFHQVNTGTVHNRLRVAGVDITYLASSQLTQFFTYQDGIDLKSGQVVQFVVPGFANSFLSISIVEEDASNSYFV